MHMPAALGREWDGAGLGQHGRALGKAPGWMLDRDKAGSHCFPLCFQVTRLLRFELFHGEGQPVAARHDRADGLQPFSRDLGRWWQVLACPTEPWVIPLIPGEAVLCRARPGAK